MLKHACSLQNVQIIIGLFLLNLAVAPIFARTVEFACLNPLLKHPNASANQVSLALIAPQPCLRVRKIRASMGLNAVKIYPVEQHTSAIALEQVTRVAIVKWKNQVVTKELVKMVANVTNSQVDVFANVNLHTPA
jgi:hypothetical protein